MFVEDIGKRAKKAKNFTDDNDSSKHACVATIVPLHYESVKDSGVFDAEIDLTARDVTDGTYQGLHASHNGFHYRYGRRNRQPGWVGFGGRQGEHWFYFKATGVGFMRGRHAAWQPLFGSPNYRATGEEHHLTPTELIPGVEVNNALAVKQSDVWSGIDITWRIGGDSLKEQIEIDAATMADIKQRASNNATFKFGFVFDIDVGDIPTVLHSGRRQPLDLPHGYDADADDTFEFINHSYDLLAFLPIDKAWVEDAEGNVIEGSERTLIKTFYRYSNRNQLFVGLDVDDLLSMPDGHKLVFDPTVDTQVGATANDGSGLSNISFGAASHALTIGYLSPPGQDSYSFWLFTGVTLEGTIDTSYCSFWSYSNADTTGLDVNVAAEDTDNPSAPTSASDEFGRVMTTAKTNWTQTTGWSSAGFDNTPSLNGSLQELVNSYTISGDNVLILCRNNGGTDRKLFRDYTNDSAKAGKFYVEYSTGNTEPTIALNTADGVSLSTTPALSFTGSDVDSDDLTYEIEIIDSSDFTLTDGEQVTDNLETGTGLTMHPQPITLTNQVDDRPGQSFTGKGGILKQAQFRITDLGTYDPWGDLIARVYEHTGTFGTSSAPVNAAASANTPTTGWLAQSGTEAVDNPSTGYWSTLDFTGVNQIRLEDGTHYLVILGWLPDTFELANTFGVQGTITAADHAGNLYNDGGSVNNGTNSAWNTWFRITEEHQRIAAASATDSGFSGTPDNTDPFAAGQQVTYTVQVADALAEATEYYWRVRVKDPSGTNTWSSWSTPRSFLTTGGSTQFAAVVDGIQFSETVARRADYSATVTDGINFSETNENIATLLATATDGIELSETVLSGLLLQALSSDQVILSEVLTGTIALIGLAQDGLTLSEAIATTMYSQGVSTDGLQMSDTSLASASYNAIALDGFTIGETLAVTSLLLGLVEDGVILSETLAGDLPGLLDGIITDGITFGDYASAQAQWFVDLVDGFNLGDIPLGDILAVGLEGSIVEGITMSDAGEVSATFHVTVSDQVTMADTIATLMAYGVVITEGFTIGDTAVHLLPTGELSVTFSTRTVKITFVAKTPRTTTTPLN